MTTGGPAFSAYGANAQAIASGSFAKVTLGTEEYDTDGAFDSTTNYRFLPTTAGYYQLNGEVSFASSSAGVIGSIYKNGTEFKRGATSGSAASSGQSANVSALVYLNGTTDYVEFYAYQNSGGSINTTQGAAYTYFQGFLARPA